MHNPRPHSLARLFACLLSLAILAASSSCRPAPTPFHITVPTPDCGAPTLLISSTSFAIKSFQPAGDSFLSVPPDSPRTAFWIQGTDPNYVFVISAASENLSMESSLLGSIAGQTAKVTWTNCNSTTYTLTAAQPGTVAASKLPAQSAPGITIFFEQDSSGAVSLVTGDLSGEEITTVNTPSANDTVQAEISLLETKPSADGKSVQVTVSILNTGAKSFILSNLDVYLTGSDGIPVPPSASKPQIPQTFNPNQKKTITFTFPRPSSPTATLQILGVQYDVTGY